MVVCGSAGVGTSTLLHFSTSEAATQSVLLRIGEDSYIVVSKDIQPATVKWTGSEQGIGSNSSGHVNVVAVETGLF